MRSSALSSVSRAEGSAPPLGGGCARAREPKCRVQRCCVQRPRSPSASRSVSAAGWTLLRTAALGALGVEHAELVAEDVADLPNRAAGSQGLTHRGQQVRLAAGSLADQLQRRRGLFWVPLGPDARSPLELSSLCFRVEAVQLDLLGIGLGVLVDAHDHLLARLHLLREREGGLLDLPLDEPLLDSGDRAADVVDSLDQLAGP